MELLKIFLSTLKPQFVSTAHWKFLIKEIFNTPPNRDEEVCKYRKLMIKFC
ncbi:hypothetical protein CONCODRAFT_6048 [Conidiobolus coronatus NRRL 28638]|uniref:Uncharacterized protein n=1 Tax=Conidiobolus coronatus (strain ATCC 28846 / CBS 209.66 / NRRL 28638) TaxID=796925 RepID=A0A137P8A0_CONC2|nr:hypothetical protein CONCODRAFT_6048 [Conidiobolus coronatus NRRL 28638]|eukprot:KXN71236.1 hypothetical protein CONCODRAFT_6048 [Conidiobolus coronatus NRRL 28638]